MIAAKHAFVRVRLRLLQTSILACGLLSLIAAAEFAKTNGITAGDLDDKTRDSFAAMCLSLHESFYQVALIFFGMSCVANSAAMVRCATPTPPALGALFGIAGLGYIADSVGLLFFPTLYTGSESPYLMFPALVAEVWLCLWLLWYGSRTVLPGL